MASPKQQRPQAQAQAHSQINSPPPPPPTTSSAPSTTSTSSSRRRSRRRGGPGGPVPVTRTTTQLSPSAAASTLNIDMSNLRINNTDNDDDTESITSSIRTGGGTNTASETANTSGTSNSSSSSSRRRRRRRRRNDNSKQGAAEAAPTSNAMSAVAPTVVGGGTGFGRIPPIAKDKKKKGGPKLAIGLDLNLELELKAKIGGDITLSLVVEEIPKPRTSRELPFPKQGEEVMTELFYMRVGTLRFNRRWIDPDAVLRGQVFLTASSALLLVACGFFGGWFASRAWNESPSELASADIVLGRGYGVGGSVAAVSAGWSSSSSSPWLGGRVVDSGGCGDGGGVADRWWESERKRGLVDATGITDRGLENSSSLH